MNKFYIILGVIVIIVIVLYYRKKSRQKKNNQRQPLQNQVNDELTFLEPNYDKQKIAELKYLTSQSDGNESDIKSVDLF